MCDWQYGEHVLEIYDCERGFLLTLGETSNLWKMLLEYQGQKTLSETESMSNPEANHQELKFCKQVPSLVEIGKIYQKKCSDRYPHCSLGITNQLANHMDLPFA